MLGGEVITDQAMNKIVAMLVTQCEQGTVTGAYIRYAGLFYLGNVSCYPVVYHGITAT